MKSRILIVDDEAALLLALQSIFQNLDTVIETSETFEDAREMIDSNNYEVIMTDLRLSDTISEEGYKITRYAKNKNANTKVILWTAYGSNDIEQKAREAGADYYFEKPVTPNEIRNVLKELGIVNGN